MWRADWGTDRGRGGRLHTARSRNDQVATDFRLYVRDVIIDETDAALDAFQHVLVTRALELAGTVMPGFAAFADRAAGDLRPSSVGLC